MIEREDERVYIDADGEEERSCCIWLLLLPAWLYQRGDGLWIERARSWGTPCEGEVAGQAEGGEEGEEGKECVASPPRWKKREAEEKMSDQDEAISSVFLRPVSHALRPPPISASLFGPLRAARHKGEIERRKRSVDGIKRRKKEKGASERGGRSERETGEKWSASERGQPRATSRAATLLREGSVRFFQKIYKLGAS